MLYGIKNTCGRKRYTGRKTDLREKNLLWEEIFVHGRKIIDGRRSFHGRRKESFRRENISWGKSCCGRKNLIWEEKWMNNTFWQRPGSTGCSGLIFRSKQKVEKRQIQNLLSTCHHQRNHWQRPKSTFIKRGICPDFSINSLFLL